MNGRLFFSSIICSSLLFILPVSSPAQCWVYGRSGTNGHLWSASFGDSLHGVIAALNSGISYTQDGGATWQQSSAPFYTSFMAVCMVDSSVAYALGGPYGGSVYVSVDGGSSWRFRSTPAGGVMFDIAFYDQNRGYIVGGQEPDSSYICRTTDGGFHWDVQRIPLGDGRYIAVVDSLTAVAVGQGGFQTTDGGISWHQVLGGGYNSVSFMKGTGQGIASGGYWTPLARTTDGGAGWYEQPNGGIYIVGAALADSAHEVAVGYGWDSSGAPQSAIRTSSDGGITWTSQPIPQIPQGVAFSSPRQGVVFGADGFLLRSSSYGCPYPSDIVVSPGDAEPGIPLCAPDLPLRHLLLSWPCSIRPGIAATHVQLSADSDFSAPGAMLVDSLVPIGGSQQLNTALRVGPLLKRHTYYWRLAWREEDSTESAWGPAYSFTTAGASVSGTVYYDLNQNGARDEGESGMAGTRVTLRKPAAGTERSFETSATSDSAGRFLIDGIDTGSYALTGVLDYPWRSSSPDTSARTITLALATDSLTGLNIGSYYPFNSISGMVFDDLNENGIQDTGLSEPGLAGWKVFLHQSSENDSVVTDSAGHFTFGHAPLGYNTVFLNPPDGWEQIYPPYKIPFGYTIYFYGTHVAGLNFAVHPVPNRAKNAVTMTEAHGIFTRTVYFGARSGATSGIWRVDPLATLIDYSEGEIELPPHQYGSFDVRFECPGGSISGSQFGLGSWVDMRGLPGFAAQTDTYKLAFTPGTSFGGAYPVTFRWSGIGVTSCYSGPVRITLPDGTILADMKSVNSLVVADSDVTQLRIIASGPRLPVAFPAGWNLISLDAEPLTRQVSLLFTFSTSSHVFAFDTPSGAYTLSDSIGTGRGYWLKLSGATESFASAPGATVITSSTQDLAEGWNLVGTIGLPLVLASGGVVPGPDPSSSGPQGAGITTDPAGIISSHFFGYMAGGGYLVADTLWPKHGYWVKARQAGTLLLGSPSLPASAAHREGTMSPSRGGAGDGEEARAGDRGRSFSRMTFSLPGEGGKRDLFFTDTFLPERELSRYELPPVPPGGVFDVRFGSGRMMESLDPAAASGAAIRLNSPAYPLTVSWMLEGTDEGNEFSLVAGGAVTDLAPGSSGRLTLTGPPPPDGDGNESTLLLQVRRRSPGKGAGEFSLSQNFPNPFNPSTELDFRIPEAGRATLGIYDMLGREVAVLLADELKEPGEYRIAWNAAGLPSGTYYARLRVMAAAGARGGKPSELYHSMRKLLLLR